MNKIRILYTEINSKWIVCVSHFVLSDSVIPWTVAHQVPLSMEFYGQEYWSGLPCLLQGNFPTQKLNPGLPHCRQIFYHLSIRPDTMELLEENIGRTLFDVNCSKIFF